MIVNPFVDEVAIKAAYDAAESLLIGIVERHLLLVVDERQRRQIIRSAAMDIADAVIRSSFGSDVGVGIDITQVPGVETETGSGG